MCRLPVPRSSRTRSQASRRAREVDSRQVIGVDRRGRPEPLARAGASTVVADLAALAVEPAGPGRARLVAAALAPPRSEPAIEAMEAWVWSYDGLDAAREGVRETLCTLGNGYFATRGAAPEARQDDTHSPGTYVAGCYNRSLTLLGDEQMDNESLVNLPNWLVLRFRIGDGDWMEPAVADVATYWQELDMRQGVLHRQMRVTDGQGRRTLVSERRIVSMAEPHLAAQQVQITAANWSGELRVCVGLDARVANLNVRADRRFNTQHLIEPLGASLSPETVRLEVQTSQSRIRIAQASRARMSVDGLPVEAHRELVDEAGFIGQELRLEVREGQTATIEKVVSLYTSRDPAISEPGFAAADAVEQADDFGTLLAAYAAAWQRLWSRFQFDVGDVRRPGTALTRIPHAADALAAHHGA